MKHHTILVYMRDTFNAAVLTAQLNHARRPRECRAPRELRECMWVPPWIPLRPFNSGATVAEKVKWTDVHIAAVRSFFEGAPGAPARHMARNTLALSWRLSQ